MASQIILEFEGVTIDQYWAVNEALGVDFETLQNVPPGMLSHQAGTTEGGLVVSEVWESREAQAAFMESRLGAALGQIQVPPPARVTWVDLAADVRI